MGVHCNQYDAVHNNGTAPIPHSALSFALCNTFCDCTQIDDVSAGVKTEGWDPQLWLVTFGAAAAHNYSFKKGGAHIIDMMMAKASSDMQDRVMEVAAKASATSAAAFDQGGELFEEKAESQTSLHDIQASCLSAVSLKSKISNRCMVTDASRGAQYHEGEKNGRDLVTDPVDAHSRLSRHPGKCFLFGQVRCLMTGENLDRKMSPSVECMALAPIISAVCDTSSAPGASCFMSRYESLVILRALPC